MSIDVDDRRSRLRRARDTLLGNPAVREGLARGAIGARIADHYAERLFSLSTGFAASRMLAAAVELDLFALLQTAPSGIDAIAAHADLPPAGARALADAMVGCRLWEEVGGGRLALTVEGLVVATDPAIRAMIAHDRLLAADLADPVAMLRRPGSGEVAALWPYRGGGRAAEYAALMTASHAFAGHLLAQSHDFGRYAHVMDVGGGEGGLVRELALRWPHLRLTLVDLPPVVERARAVLADLPRIAVVARARGEPLPSDADAVTLVRVIHDLDDGAAAGLIADATTALRPGGSLIVAEPMRRRGRDPVGAYFAAYFAAMGSGRLRFPEEITRMMAAAGLSRPRVRRRLLAGILRARKLPRHN